MAYFLRRSASLLPLLVALSCSAGEGGGTRERPMSGGGQTGGTGSGGLTFGTGGSVGVGGTLNLGGTDAGGSAGMEACATEMAQATLTSTPIDIIVVLDNSGSMAEEMGAAEANINGIFVETLNTAGVDYRVILLSRHRVADRTANEQASTSICVQAPLSGLAACPAPLPVFSERFYQWSEKIESFDALNWLINGWAQAPENDDFRDLAPNGWGPFLRAGAKKTIILMTDDDESNDTDDTPLTVDGFLQQFTALSPDFGTAAAPAFRFHSIIGIAEKNPATAAYTPDEPVNTEMCMSNGAVIESYGPTYQDLSIRTQGLRFPLCQFPSYGAVFDAIADDVIVQSVLTCDFAVPEPPAGKLLELEKVAVEHIKADQTRLQLRQAPTSADCSAAECGDGCFYIENDRVWLCESACNSVKSENGANVAVLFTCENQIIVPQ